MTSGLACMVLLMLTQRLRACFQSSLGPSRFLFTSLLLKGSTLQTVLLQLVW